MAIRTDKLMYLDTEFYDEKYFGFVNFYNSEGVAGGTVGFGNVEERRIGFYGTDNTDIFEIKNFNNVEVHNYKEDDNDNIEEYYDLNFIAKSKSLRFSLQNPDEVSALNIHSTNFNSYDKYDNKWELEADSGLLFESIGTIGLVNSSNNKMLGAFDMVDEEFTWTGDVYGKDFFNKDGVKTSYEGHTHSEHYTKTESDDRYYEKQYIDDSFYEKIEIDGRYYEKQYVDDSFYTKTQTEDKIEEEIDRIEEIPSYKDSGYYKYNDSNNTWNKINYNIVDEAYDIPNDAQENSYWYSTLENNLYIVDYETNIVTIQKTVESVEDLPNIQDGDVVYTINDNSHYEYNQSTNNWNYTNSVLVKKENHKSDIDTTNANNGDIYYISNTDKFYKLETSLVEIEKPEFVYSRLSDVPERQQDQDIYRVKGGTFYMYDGTAWREIDRPLPIPEINHYSINKYQTQNKIVFVTRR